MPAFIRKHVVVISVAIAMLFVLVTALATLTTRPRLWSDEGKTMEIARTFVRYQTLDMQTAPGTVSGFPYLLQSTGYPLTLPLAAVYALFGVGAAQTRLLMLAWMLGALAAVFLVGRKLFGDKKAAAATLLIASFSSFHDNGRAAVGEIPGFLFFMIGAYFWQERKNYWMAGLLWGIAVVAKPSVFALIVPAVGVALLIQREHFFRRVGMIAAGMLPAGFVWLALMAPYSLGSAMWDSILHFYNNPYGSSIGGNVMKNLLGAFHSSTLIYFGFFLALIVAARFFRKDSRLTSLSSFYDFVIIYAVLAFLYYLRSPGWLRYVVIAELLVFFLLPDALIVLIERAKARFRMPKANAAIIAGAVIAAMVIFQGVIYLTVANIFTSDAELVASAYLNQQFPSASIAVMNAPELSVLLKTESRFNAVDMTGIPQIGSNPLFYLRLPDVVVSRAGQAHLIEGMAVIQRSYRKLATLGGYEIYEKIQ